MRSLRSLGFVDRLVAPWVESAQRSAALRMFSSYVTHGPAQREGAAVSWVFPRPWYQDELDWMAAARQVQTQTAMEQVAPPTMLTTRGTYVPPARPSAVALPAALYEYVAPSLSVARPDVSAISTHEAYSPLVPVAASQAAQMMSRAMAPLFHAPLAGDQAAARMSPGLRAVLTTMVERSSRSTAAGVIDAPATRLAGAAPELVTPPAPRSELGTETAQQASQLADRYAEQHAQIAELQRVARVVAQRELAQTSQAAVVRTEARHERAEQAATNDQIRERVAQRAVQTQRLHEQSREAAARDARQAPVSTARVAEVVPAEVARRVPAEIAQAMSALPPELTRYIGERPERAIQAISELNEALRTVELLARNAAGGGSVETSRGPRLVMPAGLGGLVATIERAPQLAPASARTHLEHASPSQQGRPFAQPQLRVPAMSWITAPMTASGPGPTSALGATAAASPAAIQHVAWADRWLARFAGARTQSLDVLSASAARPETRLQALAAAAPESIFVAPIFDASGRGAAIETGGRGEIAGRQASGATAASVTPVQRIDDSAETPDDVFLAISAAASRSRAAAVAPAKPVEAEPSAASFARETYADAVAHSTPPAPGAGLSAQLASSPFAAALRHVMPLGAAPTFDVRALFGGNLSTSFLAGLLAPSLREVAVLSSGQSGPSWTQAGDARSLAAPLTTDARDVADWQATYVAPAAEPSDRAESIRSDSEQASARDAVTQASEQAPARLAAPLTTLRTALLSWDVETAPSGISSVGAPVLGQVSASSAGSASFGTPRAMLEAMSLPMLGEAAAMREPHQQSWTSPGMTADRAQAWSVAQERSTSDLSFDFVTPELVLAARVYGLGPTEAAQAMRLAIGGPGQLTTMASTVDRTFVQALAIDAQHRDRIKSGAVVSAVAAGGELATAISARAPERPVTAYPTMQAPGSASSSAPSSVPTHVQGAAFGVERRAPRGAFLWPSATVGALNLSAAAPDGEQSMSVAALELLAAQAVAELGTFAAFSGESQGELAARVRRSEGTAVGSTGSNDTLGSAPTPLDSDVLASAATLVPSARRSKFEAMYLALGQTPAGRGASPAARAARALALAGRGEDTITARERASIAWDVMPQLFVGPTGDEDDDRPLSTGEVAARDARRADRTLVESRPGLGSLSARAGEALGSYVSTPSTPPAQQTQNYQTQSAPAGAVMRAPTAAPELVRTGRPSGRHGGGEVEIPAWFENAARKMFEDRGTGVSDGISLSDLTLVQAAPPSAIAASTRSVPSASPSSPAAAHPTKGGGQAIDVDKIANDVYQQILILMDAARARNGEPYL
ncbi:MAG: hypothetical protein JWO36_6809 [Myxococcales bacterium]|nr:hypothetical protein [Myxococcales bacterium]